MKLGYSKIFVAVALAIYALPSFAVGATIATAVFAGTVFAGTAAVTITAFAINMIVAAVLSKAFFNATQPDLGSGAGQSPNPGNRQQVPPATDNKLPVVYGTAWVGGTIVDLSITDNNQNLYYVLALCEVTNNGSDTISFGDVYYGGKKVTFAGNGYEVASLTDESTGVVDTTVAGKIAFYFYRNGYAQPTNQSLNAQQVMNSAGLVYTWDNTKLYTNCAFVIIRLTYSQTANIRGIEQTRFQITNSRTNTGDCFLDYLTNTVYGCAIPLAQINTASLTALTTYSNGSFSYTNSSGLPATQPRFKFNGTIDTQRPVMDNLQDMASCCDCLIKYNTVTGQWGVIVQSPSYTVAMDINDSNMISAITISPMDIAATYNVVECKFPDKSNQDSFNSSTFDLQQIAPSLLYPNEPVNKISISLPLVNNDVQAQYIANRILKSAREDLQVTVSVNYVGIQLDAGDVVTVTNANYGWVAKLFRLNKVTQTFNDDGSIAVNLTMSEYTPTIYDDVSITQFQPSPNTGIGDPTFFGTVPAPIVLAQYPTATNPSFVISANTSSSGITQYIEIYYSAFQFPTSSQLIFAGTSEIQPDGNPYNINFTVPNITLTNIPAGDWYIFSRMVNSLASSSYSPASALFRWRPSTFQYVDRYLAVAYGTSLAGAGFSFNPSGKTYYGLCNQNSVTPPATASSYTWYLADPNFGTTNYLVYINRTGRKFSFDTGLAGFAAANTFVPTQTTIFDPSIWSALPNGTNIIDLDKRTGQVIQSGGTTTGINSGEIDVFNNADGRLIAGLKPFLDFGGSATSTSTVAQLTVDIFGRVVGFETPDNTYYTEQQFTATAGQTVFSVTRSSSYISGQCWVFRNGCLLDTTEYTDTGGSTGTVTLGTGASAGDRISIVSFRQQSTKNITTTGASGTGTISTLTFAPQPYPPFIVGSSITVAGVTPTGYNGTYTVTACTTTSVSYTDTATGAQTVAGTVQYANNSYRAFQRYTANLTNATSYTASGFTLNSGFELLFLNGTIVNDQDYDIIGQTITNFPATVNGLLTIIQWNPDNLNTPSTSPVNVAINTIIAQSSYSFNNIPQAFNLYHNGVHLIDSADFTAVSTGYTLANTPTTISNIMLQQTFARTGAV